ncbi:MAG: transglutaminase domain-containing protein, partial [Pyrinomonadaceae bacterium]|nr:transglutaminase domain-containing protein [Phycisphaerales bacterium]
MDGKNLSRRRAGQLIVGGSAALYLLSSGQASGSPFELPQPKKEKQTQPAPKRTLVLTKLLTQGTKHDWTLSVAVNVNAYVERDSKGMPVVHDFKLDSAAVVFPILKDTCCHKSYTRIVKSKLKFNDGLVADRVAKYEDKYPCGTRLAKWEMRDKQGREMSLEVDIPMTCWQIRFDEKNAELVGWPTRWPQVPMSTFTDLQVIGTRSDGKPLALIDHNAENVQALLSTWTKGKDPKSIPPVVLAKFLAGQVVEQFQPSGDAMSFLKNSGFRGFSLLGAEATINDGRGSEHDIACVLCAIYRAAGLPARLVIGYDISEENADGTSFLSRQIDAVPKFRTWVEFCLYDDTSPKEIWVPVDVNRQRKISSKVQRDPRVWKYFGNNDELNAVMPIAHQFHPPTTVMAHGSPCFWGWMTFPEAQTATQFLRFNSMATPRTATSDRDREGPVDEPVAPGGPSPANPTTPKKK